MTAYGETRARDVRGCSRSRRLRVGVTSSLLDSEPAQGLRVVRKVSCHRQLEKFEYNRCATDGGVDYVIHTSPYGRATDSFHDYAHSTCRLVAWHVNLCILQARNLLRTTPRFSLPITPTKPYRTAIEHGRNFITHIQGQKGYASYEIALS